MHDNFFLIQGIAINNNKNKVWIQKRQMKETISLLSNFFYNAPVYKMLWIYPKEIRSISLFASECVDRIMF